jgi:DNA repair exonuclease SbcCD ATPase subunit
MRLLTVDADNWMGYESLRLDFSTMAGVAITGLNDHGKSALLDAITFALYGVVGRKVGRGADRFIRDGAEALAVHVVFLTSDGHTVSVTREKERGATGVLRLTVDGAEQTANTSDATQTRVTDLVGLDYDALTASAFMVQHDSAAFMLADPRDRKDLLIALLGLDQFEPLHKAAKEIADRASAEVADATARVATHTAAITAGAGATLALAGAVEALRVAREANTAAQAALGAAKEAFVTKRAEWTALTRIVERAQTVAQQRASLPDEIAALREEVEQAEAEAAEPEPGVQMPPAVPQDEVEEVVLAIREVERVLAEASRLDERLAREREKLMEAEQARSVIGTVPCGAAGIYATCPLLQAVPTEGQIVAIRADLDATAGHLATVTARTAERDALEARRQEFAVAQQFYVRAQNGARIVQDRWRSRVDAARRVAAAKRQTLVAAETALASLADVPEADAAAEEAAAMAEIVEALRLEGVAAAAAVKDAAADVEEAEGAWQTASRLAAQVELAQAALGEEEERRATAAERYEIHSALAAAWHRDGVPTEIIERALPMIEAKANDVLARLPEELVIALRTQRPTKRGKGMAETLDIIVTIDGVEREYGLLSWGARLRVDIALRLALGEILTHRSGKRIETLWLDEPLADLDPEGVEAMLELLVAISSDFPLVVVVSHNTSFSDALAHQIVVRKVDGISTITVDGEAA